MKNKRMNKSGFVHVLLVLTLFIGISIAAFVFLKSTNIPRVQESQSPSTPLSSSSLSLSPDTTRTMISSNDFEDWKTYSNNHFSFKYPPEGKIAEHDSILNLEFNCSRGELKNELTETRLESYLSTKYEEWRFKDYYQSIKWKYEEYGDPFEVDHKNTIFVGPEGLGETDTIYFENNNIIYSFNLRPKYGEGTSEPEGIKCESTNIAAQILTTFRFKQ